MYLMPYRYKVDVRTFSRWPRTGGGGHFFEHYLPALRLAAISRGSPQAADTVRTAR